MYLTSNNHGGSSYHDLCYRVTDMPVTAILENLTCKKFGELQTHLNCQKIYLANFFNSPNSPNFLYVPPNFPELLSILVLPLCKTYSSFLFRNYTFTFCLTSSTKGWTNSLAISAKTPPPMPPIGWKTSGRSTGMKHICNKKTEAYFPVFDVSVLKLCMCSS